MKYQSPNLYLARKLRFRSIRRLPVTRMSSTIWMRMVTNILHHFCNHKHTFISFISSNQTITTSLKINRLFAYIKHREFEIMDLAGGIAAECLWRGGIFEKLQKNQWRNKRTFWFKLAVADSRIDEGSRGSCGRSGGENISWIDSWGLRMSLCLFFVFHFFSSFPFFF